MIMVDKFELKKEHSDCIINIVETYFKQYNRVQVGFDGYVELFVNYKGHMSFSDYGLNYDNFTKIHWVEFMTSVLIKEKIIPDYNSIEYIRDIFIHNIHPIESYKKWR